MLLALRRFFGFAESATDEETEDRDWRSRKWVIEPSRLGFMARLGSARGHGLIARASDERSNVIGIRQ